MPLEDLTGADKYIDDLVVTNPVGGVDEWKTLDNHIRGIKNVLKNTFAAVTGAITVTHTAINNLVEKIGATWVGPGALNMADFVIQRAKLLDTSEVVVVVAASTGSYNINLEAGNVIDITLTANCTFTFSNWPATGFKGQVLLYVRQNGVGGHTMTWPAAVKWPNGYKPPISSVAGSLTILQLVSVDGGTTIQGLFGGAAFA